MSLSIISTPDNFRFESKDYFKIEQKSSIGKAIIRDCTIGAETGYSGNGAFNGKLGSVLIYDRALTDEEIQHNYQYEQSIERGE